MQEGLKQGIEKGRKEGEEKGLQRGKQQIARTMRAAGMDTQTVAQMTGLTVQEVEALG